MKKINLKTVQNMDSLQRMTFEALIFGLKRGIIGYEQFDFINGFMHNERRRTSEEWVKEL